MRRNSSATKFFRRLLLRLKRGNSKQLLITVSAALSIGLVFGFLMLQMVHSDEKQETYHVYATTETSEDQKEQTKIDLPKLEFYVHQGGVYSNKENAEQLSKQLTNKNIPFIVREEDGQYFVWMNLRQTKSEVEELSTKMDEHGIEVYVKEWNLPAATAFVGDQTSVWLEEFLSVLELAIENGTIQQAEIEKLVTMEVKSKQVETWQQRLDEIVSNDYSEEQLFFQIIVQYEKMIEDIKE